MNDSTALAWLTGGLVFANILLVFVTAFYARQTKRLADDTKRMADILVRDYETKIRPLLDIGLLTRDVHGIGVWIKNRGQHVIEITRICLIWRFIDEQNERIKPYDSYNLLYPEDSWSQRMQISTEEFASCRPKDYNEAAKVNAILNDIEAKIRIYFKGVSGTEESKDIIVGRLS